MVKSASMTMPIRAYPFHVYHNMHDQFHGSRLLYPAHHFHQTPGRYRLEEFHGVHGNGVHALPRKAGGAYVRYLVHPLQRETAE